MEDESDSESEIFVLQQIKPVLPITREQGLMIKDSVLNKSSFVENDDISVIKDIPASNHDAEKQSNIKKTSGRLSKKVSKAKRRVSASSIQDLEKNERKSNHSTTLQSVKNVDTSKNINEGNKTEKEEEGEIFKDNINNILNEEDNIMKNVTKGKKTQDFSNDVIDLTIENKPQSEVLKTPGKKIKNALKRRSMSASPSKTITDYFSPTKKLRKVIENSLTNLKTQIGNLEETGEVVERQGSTLSTAVACSSEEAINAQSTASSSKTSMGKSNGQKDSDQNGCLNKPNEEASEGGSDTYSQIFQIIIRDEIVKQVKLKTYALETGEEFDRLLLDTDCNVVEQFFQLPDSAKKLYVRMLCRNKTWHRKVTIKYDDISPDILEEIKILQQLKFFDTNVETEDLRFQLGLLKMGEIQKICKLFNVPYSTKIETIDAILRDTKEQISVADHFTKNTKLCTRQNLLQNEVQLVLGCCFKLSHDAMAVFQRIILLFSLTHTISDESKRLNEQYLMILEAMRGITKYPKYKVSQTVIFTKREDLLLYEEALKLQYDFDVAVTVKNHDQFITLGMEAQRRLNEILLDRAYRVRVAKLPNFLKKYSAGAVYAYVLTKFCDTFKTKVESDKIVSVLSMLIEQQLFLTSKRGKWYELLILAHESQKDSLSAAKTGLLADKDENVNEVQKLALQLKCRKLLKKKLNGIKDGSIRDKLDDVATISVQEPSSIEIKAKALENVFGGKSVYVQETENGNYYVTVEDQAIMHYKENGFLRGLHVEGSLIQTLYFLLFFDIIYGLSPPGVFQSPYQEYPLDMFSRSFYESRQTEIDERLNDLLDWGIDGIRAKIQEVFTSKRSVKSVISWDDRYSPALFCEIIQCLGIPALQSICRRLGKNYRLCRSGFPDLTLWNSETKKCKFVEVKSPNDKLSPGQRIWLNFLRNIGVDCEVCNVKNVGSRTYKAHKS